MISCTHSINHSLSGNVIEVNARGVFHTWEKGDSSGIQMGPRQMKAQEPACTAMAWDKVLALA
jgi:hypothetical protein